jgi:hypothetical protein
MIRVRRLASAFWLALALLLGQQAAALHALGHATERLHQHEAPAPSTCDQCGAFTQFAGAAPAFVAAIAIVAGLDLVVSAAFTPAPSRTVVTSRSRAPPSVL